MTKVVVQKRVEAEPSRVWEILADFGGIHRVHPYVDRSPLLTEQTTGVGTERVCHFSDGNHVKERVTAWETGKSMTVEIVDGTMPLSRAVATFNVVPEDGGTIIEFAMDYEPKWGLVGKLMDAAMMRRKFETIMRDVLSGIEEGAAAPTPVATPARPSMAMA